MPRAVIMSPPQTLTGNFNVGVTFGEDVTGFGNSNVEIHGVTNNGAMGVSYEVSGMQGGNSFNIMFVVPPNAASADPAEGSFRIELVGTVNIRTSSQPQTIDSEDVVVSYDTLAAKITANFSQPIYEDDRIRIPVNFSRDVLYFSKTDCELERFHGDLINDFEYYLLGSGRVFELVVVPAVDRLGAFTVNIIGNVLTSEMSDDRGLVDITPVFVPYNSRRPRIVEYESLNELSEGAWDVEIGFDVPARGVGIDDFILKGENVFTPILYRAMSLDVKPKVPPLSLDLDNPPECVDGWVLDSAGSQREARYILLRFNVPRGVTGSLTVDLKDDVVLPASLEHLAA